MKNSERKLLALALFLLPLGARAGEIAGMGDFLRDQVDATTTAANSCAAPAADTDQEWFFRRIWIRVRPQLKISLPGLADIEFIPEVEMLVERKLPDGWGTYSP